MNCPVCNVVLDVRERQGVEIDICPACRGIWLDRGELDKLIERSDSQPLSAFANGHQDDHAHPERRQIGHDGRNSRPGHNWASEFFG